MRDQLARGRGFGSLAISCLVVGSIVGTTSPVWSESVAVVDLFDFDGTLTRRGTREKLSPEFESYLPGWIRGIAAELGYRNEASIAALQALVVDKMWKIDPADPAMKGKSWLVPFEDGRAGVTAPADADEYTRCLAATAMALAEVGAITRRDPSHELAAPNADHPLISADERVALQEYDRMRQPLYFRVRKSLPAIPEAGPDAYFRLGALVQARHLAHRAIAADLTGGELAILTNSQPDDVARKIRYLAEQASVAAAGLGPALEHIASKGMFGEARKYELDRSVTIDISRFFPQERRDVGVGFVYPVRPRALARMNEIVGRRSHGDDVRFNVTGDIASFDLWSALVMDRELTDFLKREKMLAGPIENVQREYPHLADRLGVASLLVDSGTNRQDQAFMRFIRQNAPRAVGDRIVLAPTLAAVARAHGQVIPGHREARLAARRIVHDPRQVERYWFR